MTSLAAFLSIHVDKSKCWNDNTKKEMMQTGYIIQYIYLKYKAQPYSKL